MGPLYRLTEDRAAGEGGGRWRWRGGVWWLEKAKGQKRELLKLSRKRVPFCWQTQAGNVNWGQRKVSVFTGPASSSRTESEKTGLLGANTTSAYSTTVLHSHLSAHVVLVTFSQSASLSVFLLFIYLLQHRYELLRCVIVLLCYHTTWEVLCNSLVDIARRES